MIRLKNGRIFDGRRGFVFQKSVLILFSLLLVLSPFTSLGELSYADDVEADYEWVDNNDGGVTITKYKGPNDIDLVIPDQLDGKDVTVIGEEAFKYPTALKSVVIPDTVTKIEKTAFHSAHMSHITFSKNLKEIGPYAFAFNNFTYIDIPESVEVIKHSAFFRNDELLEVEIYNPNLIFDDQNGVIFPNRTTVVFRGFEGSTTETYTDGNLRTFVPFSRDWGIEQGMHWLENADGTATIFGYTGQENIDLRIPTQIEGKSVSRIGQFAFRNIKLNSVRFLQGLIEIEKYSFFNSSLKEVNFPPNLKIIGNSAFLNNDLEVVTLPKGLEKVEPGAFSQNDNLKEVIIYNPNVDLGTSRIFSALELDLKIRGHDPSTAKEYAERYNHSFEPFGDYIWKYISPDEISIVEYLGSDKDLEIPNQIEGIDVVGLEAFSFRDKGLESVILPEKLRFIANEAFSKNQLETIDIPDSVITIGVLAFMNNKLKSVSLPKNLKDIERRSFSGNQIEEIDIPYGVKKIQSNAFTSNQLKSVEIPETVDQVENSAFSSNDSLSDVYVYNPSMEFGDNVFYILNRSPEEVTIHGYSNSTAETYAKDNNHSFRSLSEVRLGDEIDVFLGQKLTILNADDEIVGKLHIVAVDDPTPFDGVKLRVTEVENLNLDGLDQAGVVLDFNFFDHQDPRLELEGEFELSLLVDGGARNYDIYHEEEAGRWEKIGGTTSDGMVHASVTNFSKYGVFSPTVDKSDLENLVNEARQLDEDLYTPESFELVRLKLENAEQILADDHATQEVVDAAYNELQEAINGLVPKSIINISVEKIWEGAQAEEVIIYLTANGKRSTSITLNSLKDWQGEFENLPVYDENGNPWDYGVEEEPIEGYETSITGTAEDGFTVTNTEILPEPEYVDIDFRKEWVGEPAESVTVYLVIDGVRSEIPGITITEADDWSGSFTGLARYDLDGSPYEYTIEEEPIDGYETSISGSAEDGFVITNTEIKEEAEDPVEEPEDPVEEVDDPEKESEDPEEDTSEGEEESGGKKLPKTASNHYNLVLVGLFILLLGGVLYLLARRKA